MERDGYDTALSNSHAELLRQKPLNTGTKLIYGSGQMVDAIMNTALNTFLFFYLTIVCGLSGTLTGVSLFVALTIDAIADPFLGSLSDNCWTKWGRRFPFMLISVVPIGLGLGLLFSIPRDFTGWSLFAYVTATAIVLRVGFSAYSLPHVALGAELSDDYRERSNIVGYRALFAVVGTVVCLILGFFVFLRGPNGLLDRTSYTPFGWSCGLLVFAIGLFCAFGTLPTLGRLYRVEVSLISPVRQLFRDVSEIFRNRSFLALFSAVLMSFVAAGTAGILGLHAAKFFWALPSSMIQILALTLPVGNFIGIPIGALLARRFEKRTIVIAGTLTIFAGQLSLPLLKIAGLLPDGFFLYSILIANGVVAAVCAILCAIAFQSMLADAADEHEHLFVVRREALFFAGLTFSAKAASGVGALVAGTALDMIGFPSDIASHSDAARHIPAHAIEGLGLLSGPAVSLLTLIAALLILYYRLDKTTHARIKESLRQRRETMLGNPLVSRQGPLP